MVEPRVLALDVGSSSVRARVFDASAAAAPDVGAKREHDLEPGGILDPERLLADARTVVDETRAHAPAITACGGSCFWHSLLALDARGRPLTPLLTWRDVRSAPQARELERRVDPEAVHARTGCPLHAGFWPTKLAWLRAEQPDAFGAARRFVGFAEWFLEHEVGEARASVSMASATGLWTDAGWDGELLDVLGIDPEQLPAVGDEPVGDWHPLLGDGACANLGSGCTTPDRAALTIGTSAAVRVVATTDDPAPAGLFRYRIDERRALLGGALSTGGNLHEWLEQTLRLPDASGIAERPPAGHGLAFVPLLAGERAPGWNAERRGTIAGLRFETTPLDILQAGLEGVALELRRVTDLLPPVREVVASGAAVRNVDWLQIVADVLERPLAVSDDPEASVRGAAVAVLERIGHDPPVPAVSRTLEPRRERTEAYRSAMERHLRLMQGVT